MDRDNVAQAKDQIRRLMFALNLLPREGDPYYWREKVSSGSFEVSASLPSGSFCACACALDDGGAYYDAWVEVKGNRVATLCGGVIGGTQANCGASSGEELSTPCQKNS